MTAPPAHSPEYRALPLVATRRMRLSVAVLTAWIAIIFIMTPLSGHLRDLLKVPAFYWTAFFAATGLLVAIFHPLLRVWLAVLGTHPFRVLMGSSALLGVLTYEIVFNVRFPVERFHFVVYAILGLFWTKVVPQDISGWITACAGAITVGIADEIIQFYLASRVGDLHDIRINIEAALLAIGLVVLLATQHTPAARTNSFAPSLLTLAALCGAATWFATAAICGYTIELPGGQFFSLHSAELMQILSKQQDYVRNPAPNRNSPLFSLEDHYYAEGIHHLQARNQLVGQKRFRLALFENEVLEGFYQPILRVKGGRWSAQMRRHVEQAARAVPIAPTDSLSATTGPSRAYWMAVGLLVTCAFAIAAAKVWTRADPIAQDVTVASH